MDGIMSQVEKIKKQQQKKKIKKEKINKGKGASKTSNKRPSK